MMYLKVSPAAVFCQDGHTIIISTDTYQPGQILRCDVTHLQKMSILICTIKIAVTCHYFYNGFRGFVYVAP